MPDPTPFASHLPERPQPARSTATLDEPAPRERYPATSLLCALWVIVYLGMAWHQGTIHAVGQNVISGGILPETLHRFGSMSPAEVRGGEPWRALTSAFLHSSLLHLGFNLLMLYQLGREVETWYGPWQAFGVYTVIGLGANLLAAWAKPWLGHPMMERSVGGSGVVCGLIALVAVVGWRSRTRIGDFYRAQMVGLLIFIAILGWVMPGVDNVVHASGAVLGAVVGLAHRRLVRWSGRRPARAIGAAALALTLVCGAAQARVAFLEVRFFQLYEGSQRRAETLGRLIRTDLIYQQASSLRTRSILLRDPKVRALRLQLRAELRALDEAESGLSEGPTAPAYRTVQALAWQESLGAGGDTGRFREAMKALAERVKADQERSEQAFNRLARRFGGGVKLRIPAQAVVRRPVQGE